MNVDDFLTDLTRCQIEFGPLYFEAQQEKDGFDGKRQIQMIHHIGNVTIEVRKASFTSYSKTSSHN